MHPTPIPMLLALGFAGAPEPAVDRDSEPAETRRGGHVRSSRPSPTAAAQPARYTKHSVERSNSRMPGPWSNWTSSTG